MKGKARSGRPLWPGKPSLLTTKKRVAEVRNKKGSEGEVVPL